VGGADNGVFRAEVFLGPDHDLLIIGVVASIKVGVVGESVSSIGSSWFVVDDNGVLVVF
jgi:hypothetical protein